MYRCVWMLFFHCCYIGNFRSIKICKLIISSPKNTFKRQTFILVICHLKNLNCLPHRTLWYFEDSIDNFFFSMENFADCHFKIVIQIDRGVKSEECPLSVGHQSDSWWSNEQPLSPITYLFFLPNWLCTLSFVN